MDKRYGLWKIDSDGDIIHKENGYWIEQDRLTEDDWLLHMSRKGWCDMNEFFRVFSDACEKAKVDSRQRVKYGKEK